MFLLFLIIGCSRDMVSLDPPIDIAPTIHVKIENISPFNFENVIFKDLNGSVLDFGSISTDNSSEYKTFGLGLDECQFISSIKITIEGQEFDFVTDEPNCKNLEFQVLYILKVNVDSFDERLLTAEWIEE